MYLLDSTIFLHYMQNGENTKQVEELLKRIHDGRMEGMIAYDAIITIKDHLLKANLVRQLGVFFEAITEFSNLHVYYLSMVEENYVIKVMFKFKIGYLQALHYYLARKHNVKLISFNDAYKKIPDIKVVTP